MAEKEGFEPSIQFYPYTFLAGKRLRPLGHFSFGEYSGLNIVDLKRGGDDRGEEMILQVRIKGFGDVCKSWLNTLRCFSR